jgi:two-component system C4-dicarboxylate transport sensor histidine kinase DctB
VLDATSLELALDTLQKRIDLLQQSLTQQNKLATLGMVTAVIAHEFNNILTPMISYTKFALTNKADEALRTKALTKALGGAERMANISKSLLGFARGDESNVAPVLPAVRETLACLARDLAKDGITLVLDVPDGLVAAMNAGHLQQVLMNLIVNARSAMLSARGAGGGGKRLTIRAGVKEACECKGKMIVISLADTGPGIPADVLPRIFEPFFSTKRGAELHEGSGNTEESMPRGGTGLGLTICQELVRVAGGTIGVTSEEGEGAVFVIELPFAA